MYASNQTIEPSRKPTMTNQWKKPTERLRAIRVWAATSTMTFFSREKTGPKRLKPSFWPSMMLRTIRETPPMNEAQQIKLSRTPIVPSVMVTPDMVRGLSSHFPTYGRLG